jgi:hypothetical protein
MLSIGRVDDLGPEKESQPTARPTGLLAVSPLNRQALIPLDNTQAFPVRLGPPAGSIILEGSYE